jgi:hypothetical protein
MRIRVGGSVGRPALRRRGAVAALVAGPVASRGFAGLRLGLGKGDHHGNARALARVVAAFLVLLEDASATNLGGHCVVSNLSCFVRLDLKNWRSRSLDWTCTSHNSRTSGLHSLAHCWAKARFRSRRSNSMTRFQRSSSSTKPVIGTTVLFVP